MNASGVQSFRNSHPRGDRLVGGLRRTFVDHYESSFTAYDTWHYRQETYIAGCSDEIDWRGKKVLEIESEQIIRRCAHWSDLDLMQEFVDRIVSRLVIRNLPHNDLRQGSAMAIPCLDDTFDLVFRHDVLHHIPDVRTAQNEIHRVRKPGGILVAMLYSRVSLNYQLSIKIVCRAALVAAYPLRRSRLRFSSMLRQHLDNAESESLQEYLVISNFTHRSTDGPHNFYLRVYSLQQMAREFPNFEMVQTFSRYSRYAGCQSNAGSVGTCGGGHGRGKRPSGIPVDEMAGRHE